MQLLVVLLTILSVVHGIRVRLRSVNDSLKLPGSETQPDLVDDKAPISRNTSHVPINDFNNVTTSHLNITAGSHNISSNDDMAWGQGALSNNSADTGNKIVFHKNVTKSDGEAESAPRQIGTSAFLFVTVPLIALVAAVASKYGKNPNEMGLSRTPKDLEDNYSSHRMITTASDDDRDCNEHEDRDVEDSSEVAFGTIPVDRKLFVQVYKPHRDQTELSAIKNRLATALYERGDVDQDRDRDSPAVRGAGRYNLAGRHSYTPDDDSEHNSPFEEPSIPI